MPLNLKKVRIAERWTSGRRNGFFQETEWAEFVFASREDPVTGYKVTIAAVWVPDRNALFWGSSACTPSDITDGVFIHQKGADKALGRARQFASYFLSGAGPVRTPLIDQPYVRLDALPDMKTLRKMAKAKVAIVAAFAMEVSLQLEIARLNKIAERIRAKLAKSLGSVPIRGALPGVTQVKASGESGSPT